MALCLFLVFAFSDSDLVAGAASLLLLAAFAVVPAILWFGALIEALRAPDWLWARVSQNKLTFVALMVVLAFVGVLLYLAIARPALYRAARVLPASPPREKTPPQQRPATAPGPHRSGRAKSLVLGGLAAVVVIALVVIIAPYRDHSPDPRPGDPMFDASLSRSAVVNAINKEWCNGDARVIREQDDQGMPYTDINCEHVYESAWQDVVFLVYPTAAQIDSFTAFGMKCGDFTAFGRGPTWLALSKDSGAISTLVDNGAKMVSSDCD